MSANYLFSQFDTKQFGQDRDANLKVSAMTPKVSNNGHEQIARTEGNATLSDFIVAPQSRSQATSFSSLLELSQGRRFQMIKIGS